MEIRCRNVTDGLAKGLGYLLHHGVEEPSRNGTVLAAPEPVIITYQRPWERVLFSPLRNANPFFHLFESLWMLAGRNDLSFPMKYNSRFAEYSDDGNSINGAYGFRWREHFDRDQLSDAIYMLRNDSTTRRVVIGMWDPMMDLGSKSKDIPCNTHIYVDTRDGLLNMTVCNRSNDVLWGAFGANAVHMSVLQEYLAAKVVVPTGLYRQFTNNLHLYTDILSREAAMQLAIELSNENRYERDIELGDHVIMSGDMQVWERDLQAFVDHGADFIYGSAFFSGTAAIMAQAWDNRKTEFGLHVAQAIADPSWRMACIEWLERVATKRGSNA